MNNTKNLDNLLNKAASNKKVTSKINKKDKSNSSDKNYLGRTIKEQEIFFEINDDDDIMIASIKEFINKSHLKNTDVYEVVGRETGYNMIYQLGNKNVLSWARLEVWCMILGVEPIITFKQLKKEDK